MQFWHRSTIFICAIAMLSEPLQAHARDNRSAVAGTEVSATLQLPDTPLPTLDLPPAGDIYAIAQTDSTIYVGGDFSYVGGVLGSIIRFDANLIADTTFPQYERVARRITADEQGRRYALDGNGNNIWRMLPDGSIDPTWQPDLRHMTGSIHAILAAGQYVYIGGTFGFFDGPNRDRGLKDLLMIDATTGAIVQTWNPLKNGRSGIVRSLAIDQNRLFVGMSFSVDATNIGPLLIQIDRTTGAILPWETGLTAATSVDGVEDMRIVDNALVVAGSFDRTGNRTYIAAFRLGQGTPTAIDAFPSSPRPIRSIVSYDGDVAFWTSTTQNSAGEQITTYARVNVRTLENRPWTIKTRPGESEPDQFAITGSEVIAARSLDTFKSELARYDSATGNRVGESVLVSGYISLLTWLDNSLYISSGQLSSAGGRARNGLAAYDRATGKLKAWSIQLADNSGSQPMVNSLAFYKDALIIGGGFRSIQDERRFGVAAVDQETGALRDWSPDIEGWRNVTALLVHQDRLYIAGEFTFGPNNARGYDIAAFDLATYNTVPLNWKPITDRSTLRPFFHKLAVHGTTLYALGSFHYDAIGRRGALAIDLSSGNILPWQPEGVQSAYDIAFAGTTAFVTGVFGNADTTEDYVAEVTLDTGARTAWDVSIQQVDDPMPAPVMLNAVDVDATTVYVGGLFNRVNGQQQRSIALFDRETGEMFPFDTTISGVPRDIDVTGRFLTVLGGVSSVNGCPTQPIVMIDLVVQTGAARMIGERQAEFTGVVRPDGKTVSVSFMLTTTSGDYSASTTVVPAQPAISGTRPQRVIAQTPNLKPAVYYYRMVSTGPDGTFYGNEFMLDARLKTFLPFLR